MMPPVDWHLVRSGHVQINASQRQPTGGAFQFLPLFRTYQEACHYCRQSGLWHQGIRPRQNQLATRREPVDIDALALLMADARRQGISVAGVFVGFSDDLESCWEYFRLSPNVEPLPDDERPV